MAGGWFAEKTGPEAGAALVRAAEALRTAARVDSIALPGAEAGRAAAYIITDSESAAFHLERLRTRAAEFDPDTRDRFLAGAMLPAAWVVRAQRVRRWWLDRMLAVFDKIDLVLAPATPCPAPLIGQKTLAIGGHTLPLRPNLGLMAQPFSAIGPPVGVQLVGPPWREDFCLRTAAHLEAAGIARAHPPRLA